MNSLRQETLGGTHSSNLCKTSYKWASNPWSTAVLGGKAFSYENNGLRTSRPNDSHGTSLIPDLRCRRQGVCPREDLHACPGSDGHDCAKHPRGDTLHETSTIARGVR